MNPEDFPQMNRGKYSNGYQPMITGMSSSNNPSRPRFSADEFLRDLESDSEPIGQF